MTSEFLEIMRKKIQQRLNKASMSIDELREMAKAARTPHAFTDVFQNDCTVSARIVAEIKFSSPSLGIISMLNDPVNIASQYLENGASAISVLTEEEFFKGSLEYLKRVRAAFPNARLLMKDFILDESQILQAKINGADAVLLIAAFLSFDQLKMLYTTAIDLGLTPLVEVHTLNELKNVEAIGAKLIGINNRDLQSLKVDLDVSRRLREHATSNAIFISESGIHTGSDINQLQKLGYHGFLIGGKLMASQMPGFALNAILQEAANAR